MQITCYNYDGAKQLKSYEVSDAIQADDGAVWIDITDPSAEQIETLNTIFGFHPLAIEDVNNQEQRPKAEEFSDHLFIILNPVELKDGELTSRELDIFVGNNYLITIHQKPETIIFEAQNRIDPKRIPFSISETYLLYVLFDTVVDSYLPLLELVDNEIDEIGNNLILNPDPLMQSQLFKLKRSLNLFWWIVWPQLDILNTLTKHDLVFIEEKSKYYLRDIEDHLRRITDMIQLSRDSVNGLINLYVSAVSNQLNHAVNRLSIITIIIGALAVISGFYGMNFERTWPPFDAEWGVPAVLIGMIVLTIAIYAILRKRI